MNKMNSDRHLRFKKGIVASNKAVNDCYKDMIRLFKKMLETGGKENELGTTIRSKRKSRLRES